MEHVSTPEYCELSTDDDFDVSVESSPMSKMFAGNSNRIRSPPSKEEQARCKREAVSPYVWAKSDEENYEEDQRELENLEARFGEYHKECKRLKKLGLHIIDKIKKTSRADKKRFELKERYNSIVVAKKECEKKRYEYQLLRDKKVELLSDRNIQRGRSLVQERNAARGEVISLKKKQLDMELDQKDVMQIARNPNLELVAEAVKLKREATELRDDASILSIGTSLSAQETRKLEDKVLQLQTEGTRKDDTIVSLEDACITLQNQLSEARQKLQEAEVKLFQTEAQRSRLRNAAFFNPNNTSIPSEGLYVL